MKRCKECRYPAPMHQPACVARETGLQDVKSEASQARLAIDALLRAISELPQVTKGCLSSDATFMSAFRAAKKVIE